MTAGKFFPGTLPWSAFEGAYTVSADGETITGSGEIRSPWINVGTLAKVDWTGSGTPTSPQMRSSVLPPDRRNDMCVIQPAASELTWKYDPSSGNLCKPAIGIGLLTPRQRAKLQPISRQL